MSATIAIVGGGFSGTMLAVRLAEAGVRVRLINRTPDFGPGLAYSTDCDQHVLNVRSGRMSARADDPGHFVRWLETNHPALADPQGFAPRQIYGDYIRANLAEARRAFPDHIELIVGEVVDATTHNLRLADGRRMEADAVVLATGNPPPRARETTPGVIADPWAPGALDAVGPSHAVIVVGTGLTMIDALLALEERGWVGEATALSRRGLTPRLHDAPQPHPAPLAPPPGPLSQRLAWARRQSKEAGWAVMMDRLRDLNAELWGDLPEAQRARFLRHLRPWWDVHRHRVAPEPAARLRAMIEEGRLRIAAGRVLSISSRSGQLAVRWRARGEQRDIVQPVDRLIDCTGPDFDAARTSDRLTAALVDSGHARAAPLGLGLDVDVEGRLVGADGRASDRLLALGPPARAALWETTAVPDIRKRVDSLAVRLNGALSQAPGPTV